MPQVARPDLDVLDLAVGVHLENQDSHARVGHAVLDLDHEGSSVHRQELSSPGGMLIALEKTHHLGLSLVYYRMPQGVLRHQDQACVGRQKSFFGIGLVQALHPRLHGRFGHTDVGLPSLAHRLRQVLR